MDNMYLYDGLTFSDNMTISWFPNKPVNTARLIDYDDDEEFKAWTSGDLMRGVCMDKLHADVIVFPDPVLMYIPTESIHIRFACRRIYVQGTVNKVLTRIYKEYQKNAKQKEKITDGRGATTQVGLKLIDQMYDLNRYLGWTYDESSKTAYLYLC